MVGASRCRYACRLTDNWVGVADDAIRDQVMRHDPMTGVFSGAYMNHRVKFNTQDAFLERDVSDDGLTRAFAHMSIRCNPGIPKVVPDAVLQALPPDPDIVALESRQAAMFQQLRYRYKFVKRAPPAPLQEYQELGRQLANARKSLREEIAREFKRDYIYRSHNEQMKRQLDKSSVTDVYVEPVVQHQLEERTLLQCILCDFSTDLDMKDIIGRKIRAINLFVALASKQETQKQRPPKAGEAEIKEESPSPDPSPTPVEIPLICKKTQCIFCIGNEKYSYEKRLRTFRRVSHMMDHVEDVHLRYQDPDEVICHHPMCRSELPFKSINLFKNHVARVHEITLREPRYVG
jgi:hypothetical protein